MYPKWCISLSQFLHSGGCPLKSMKIYKQNIFDLDYGNLRPVFFKAIFCSSISLKISATASSFTCFPQPVGLFVNHVLESVYRYVFKVVCVVDDELMIIKWYSCIDILGFTLPFQQL
uniref:Uncharacterized protein n=1 Tax=Cacopsylla melanoneura TaxID=428564 RepID=A0A8D8YTU4_9HEMI